MEGSGGFVDRRLADYVSLITDSLASQDGSAFAAALAINATNSYAETVSSCLDHTKDPARILKQVDKHAPLGEMLLHHTRAMQCYHQNRYVDAYNSLEKSANAFLQEYRNWESTWAMEALHVIVYALRTVGEMADREMAMNGKAPDKLKGAGSFLMKVFGAIQGKGPKRVGALYVTCQLFKIYFKLGTVHMCRSVIRSIDTSRFFDFEDFPAKDRVTYMYYTGRLEVFNDNVSAADRKLTYALERCDPFKKANIRMILKYLVPVRLALGVLPKESLLTKYNLSEYIDVVRALKRGDVRLLRRALKANENNFFRSGVYLVLEKLESHVYRRLLRKMCIQYPKAAGSWPRPPSQDGGDPKSYEVARGGHGHGRGGMLHGNSDPQGTDERLLFAQEPSGGAEQAGPLPEARWATTTVTATAKVRIY
ncbi:enhanced ethylene response protein 5 isoform X1 [Selaginella moellendorffii]|uniref:enhanced ethylene response protein 5 isoform X1 n=1 Tax=Selaginella moellendorffii TaxID=88036 RepID=UPI000D1C4C29|nr:enhanced ethylene response protein 5 isoform X1 [Selaginella moellendorffii]|eukprot:XP_024531356.1 enhanced ethylene response protein 5 isoform X1 [Selaginella moellendorffii]